MKKGSWSLISTFLVILKIASAVKFWQITDLHYDEFYHEKGDTNQFCHFKNGSAGRYGDYQCEGRLYNTVWKLQKFSTQCGNFRNFPPLQKFFVKLIYSFTL